MKLDYPEMFKSLSFRATVRSGVAIPVVGIART
jgi:hypothetical protein